MTDTSTDARTAARCTDPAEFLRVLHAPGDCFEVRIPSCPAFKGAIHKRAPERGFFVNAVAAGNLAAAFDREREPKGIYVTLNPVFADLLALANERIIPGTSSAKDEHILRRRWLFLDIDPVRAIDGVSATDAESNAAIALAKEVAYELEREGWPEPLRCFSGNGCYLLYRIDLPNDAEATELFKGVLTSLATRFDTAGATIDTKVCNPSRILRIPGTTARKGDSTDTRPHRMAFFSRPDKPLEIVSAELLRAAAAKAPKPEPISQQVGGAATHRQNGQRGGATPLERCRAYVAEIPGAIDGQKGSDPTLQAACECVRFDLSDDDAMAVLNEYSARCSPPWTEKELRHKLADAEKKAGRGERLKEDRPANGQPGTPPIESAAAADEKQQVASVFKFITAAEFAAAAYKQQYLINRMLVAKQPAIIGGKSKALKTTIAVELALSLGSGTPFLGEFAAEKCRIGVCSGESGEFTLQETALRICAAKGVNLAETGVDWCFELPQLGRAADILGLKNTIAERKFDVLILDPGYLMLLAGDTQGLQASNVLDMGPLLLQLTEVGRVTGATIVLVHHCRKITDEKYGVPELEDLSMAGFAEWARQWLLVGRRETGTQPQMIPTGEFATDESIVYAKDENEAFSIFNTARGLSGTRKAAGTVVERLPEAA